MTVNLNQKSCNLKSTKFTLWPHIVQQSTTETTATADLTKYTAGDTRSKFDHDLCQDDEAIADLVTIKNMLST